MKTSTVKHIAKLANIPITDEEEGKLAAAFTETLDVVAKLKEVDTASTEPTHQVTGLVNLLREDEIDENQMFTQEEALANAKHQADGYFVVEQILEEK